MSSNSPYSPKTDGPTNRKSELVQAMISSRPGFIETWSLHIFLAIVLLIIGLTWLIKYPDVVEARATLMAENAPKEIVVRESGRLVKLFVKNEDTVQENTILAWMESTADHLEVEAMEKQVERCSSLIEEDKMDSIYHLFRVTYNNLGELQRPYQQFITAKQIFDDYLKNGYFTKRMLLLNGDLATLNQIHSNLIDEKQLAEQDVQLAKETFEMKEKLLDQKILSREEFRSERSKYVVKKMTIPQLQSSLLSVETQQHDKLKEIAQLQHDITQQDVIFRQALRNLNSEVEAWKKHYLIISPISGKVSFVKHIEQGQILQTGELLAYINPGDSHYYAEVTLPQNNFGKVDTGQSVQMRFDAYPYQELGYVSGKIFYISNVPSDSGFFAMIRLDKGLKTNNNNYIVFKDNLKAQALIITKNMRLFQRFYYNIVKAGSIPK